MSMGIMVEEFKYVRGVNDSEYIELLKNAYERQKRITSKAIAKLKEQPKIIRCKDCKYRDEKWRRTSVRWLPCMDVRTGGNWYCGSAEIGEQDG